MSTPHFYILLVDDEPNNLYYLEELLESQGYATASAASGEQAISIAQASTPALILLDVMMPDLDGFEVCQRLRRDPLLQTIPIIFLTALDDENSRLRGLQMMGDDYLTKPIKSESLLAKIENTFRLNEMRSQAAQAEKCTTIETKIKRQIETAWQINESLSEKFRLFVPEQLLCRIAPEGVESIQLGNAQETELSILFADIRDFTSIAEAQEARQTFVWLNGFFTQMSQAIAAQYGFIDKFLGDALLAVFDRPGYHAQDALTAGLMMRQSLQKFNAERDRYQLESPVNIGIGIHSGKALIGTLGASDRMDPTVIGDVVNTASRLENLTKIYGTSLIISETVVSQLNDTDLFHLRWIERATLRGKQRPLDVYEVVNLTPGMREPLKLLTQAYFEQGIKAYQQQDWVQSLAYFQQAIAQDPSDQVVAYYMESCRKQLGTLPVHLNYFSQA